MTKKIEPKFLLIAVFLQALIAMGGCNAIKDDLSTCIVTGSIDLRINLANKTGIAGAFSKEIKRIDLFIFTEDGTYIKRVTDSIGPFNDDYHQLLDLQKGNYKIIAWANLTEKFSLSGLTIGERCLDQGLLTLNANPQALLGGVYHTVPAIPGTLFHAISDNLSVEINKRQIFTMSLMKDTKDIQVVLHWRDNEGRYCKSLEHAERTKAYIMAENGELNFYNVLQKQRKLAYLPLYTNTTKTTNGTKSDFPVYVIPDDASTLTPFFRVMRLMADDSSQARLIFSGLQEDGSEKIIYNRNLGELIRLTGQYNTQEALDKEDKFLIEIDIFCDIDGHPFEDTWIVTHITVNGWVIKEMGTEI